MLYLTDFYLRDHKGVAAILAVDSRVHAVAEEVLVDLRIDAGRYDGAMLWHRALTLAQNARAQNAGQLGLVLDGAISVEILQEQASCARLAQGH